MYWLFGAVSGATIFLERADRRPEVALFVHAHEIPCLLCIVV